MRLPLAVVAALAAAGCISSTVDHPLKSALQGTWAVCANAGGADFHERLTFADDDLRWTVTTFATADGTCGGSGTVASDFAGSFTIGEQLKAFLDGEEVAAYALDVTDATRTFYTTFFLDADVDPRALYVGEPDLATGRDMTSGAKRPIVLTAWKPLAEEPAP